MSVEQALGLGAKTGVTLQADALIKKLQSVKVAFEILPDGIYVPKSHKFVQCHMYFT